MLVKPSELAYCPNVNKTVKKTCIYCSGSQPVGCGPLVGRGPLSAGPRPRLWI